MATIVEKKIDPDNSPGTDYTGIGNYEGAQQGDISPGGRDEIAVASCVCTGGTEDTTYFDCSGWITASGNYIKWWTDPAGDYRHNGTYQTGNKYRYVWGGTGYREGGVRINENYVRIEGIQFKHSNTQYGNMILLNDTAGACERRVTECILLDTASLGAGILSENQPNNSGKIEIIVNNVIYDFDGTGDEGILINGYNVSAQGKAIIYNNTVRGCSQGIECRNGIGGGLNVYVYNNICDSNGTGFVASASYDNHGGNVSSDATSPDGAGYINRIFTFVDAAGDDFHLQESDTGARGLGVDLSSDPIYPVTVDIDNETRIAPFDSGADQYVAPFNGSGTALASGSEGIAIGTAFSPNF